MLDRRQADYRNYDIVTCATGGREGPFKAHIDVLTVGTSESRQVHSEYLWGSFPDIEAAHAAAVRQARRYVDRQA